MPKHAGPFELYGESRNKMPKHAGKDADETVEDAMKGDSLYGNGTHRGESSG